jgi:hypothetical protein
MGPAISERFQIMPDQFSPAPDVAKIAKPIIKEHHDHLISRRIEFLFVERLDKDGNSQAILKNGKNLYGKAKLVTGLNAFLAGEMDDEATPLFVILISKHFWTSAAASAGRRQCGAIPDSELKRRSEDL